MCGGLILGCKDSRFGDGLDGRRQIGSTRDSPRSGTTSDASRAHAGPGGTGQNQPDEAC